MDDFKNKVQIEAIDTWEKEQFKGTVVMTTGSGKTRVGVLAIDKLVSLANIRSCLIIVPTTNLKNNEWEAEINLWAPHVRSIVDIECIQTAYKWQNRQFDLIIVDEIHTTLSPEYRNVYSNISYSYILGLTATVPHVEEYQLILNKIAPIIYTLSLEDAIAGKLVNDYQVYNVPVSFTREERSKYVSYSHTFTNAAMKLSTKGKSAFEVANIARSDKKHPDYLVAVRFFTGMSKRRWLCYKAAHKLDATLEIIESLPERKWIVFCQHTDFADGLQDKLLSKGIMAVSYHSKMSKKDREAALETAKSPLCSVICSAVALNTGYNLPSIDAAICTASNSTMLTAYQSLGRIIRKTSDKTAKPIFINLFVKDSQEDKWVGAKTEDLVSLNVQSIPNLLKSIKHGIA